MASIMTNIYEISRRPCYVDGTKAMFHCWGQESRVVAPSPLVGGHPGGVVSCMKAIVEYENGEVSIVRPEQIYFADDGGFSDTAWLPCEKGC